MGPAHQHLLDARQRGRRLVAEHVHIDRHFAPAKEKDAALLQHLFRDGLGALLLVGVIVRQKEKPHAEIGFLEKAMPELLDLGREKLVGNLRGHARAVARLGIGIHRAAMRQIAERLERIFQHLVRALSADLRDKADAARIMFEVRRIKRLAARHLVQNDLVQHMIIPLVVSLARGC